MTLSSLPVALRLEGRPVILVGTGAAAAAKRALLERAGAVVVGEACAAALAIVATEAPDAVVARLRARGVLVNTADRPDLCDFTLPAIVERDPVVVAVSTGGASAGLAAALRQRLELLLPAGLGRLAEALRDARDAMRQRWPDASERRRALGAALAPGGMLDPLADGPDRVADWLAGPDTPRPGGVHRITLESADPDRLTLGEARLLAQADRVHHDADVPAAILERARADAVRIAAPPADPAPSGLTVMVEWKR